jgi:RND family efflux transporter MFP subunit
MTTGTRHRGDLLLLAAALAAGLAGALAATGCSSSAENTAPRGKPPVSVDTAAVAAGTIEESVAVVGSLSPKFEAQVRAEYAGTVSEVYVTEWIPVKKGTPLAKLDTRELEAAVQAARAAALQAEAAAQRALREYDRAMKLKEVGLMTQQGLDEALTARDAAGPAADAARAHVETAETRLAKAVIRSPMDGIVAERTVSVGDYADKAYLFRVVDNRLFDLTATVPSGRISAVRTGQKLTFTTDAVPGRTFEGTVSFINPAADAGSRAIKVLAEVPNPTGELKAGLFVEGRILIGTRTGVLRVPRTALLSWDVQARKAEIFVVEGDTARRRSVSTGAAVGEDVEIAAGLAAGDRVVTRGAFNLRDGDRVAVAKASGA